MTVMAAGMPLPEEFAARMANVDAVLAAHTPLADSLEQPCERPM
jgi:hypothetical protein